MLIIEVLCLMKAFVYSIDLSVSVYILHQSKVVLWFWKLSQKNYIKFCDIALPSLADGLLIIFLGKEMIEIHYNGYILKCLILVFILFPHLHQNVKTLILALYFQQLCEHTFMYGDCTAESDISP